MPPKGKGGKGKPAGPGGTGEEAKAGEKISEVQFNQTVVDKSSSSNTSVLISNQQ